MNKHQNDISQRITEISERFTTDTDISNMSVLEITNAIQDLSQELHDIMDSRPNFYVVIDRDSGFFGQVILCKLNPEDVEDWCLEYDCEIGPFQNISFPDDETKLLFKLRWG